MREWCSSTNPTPGAWRGVECSRRAGHRGKHRYHGVTTTISWVDDPRPMPRLGRTRALLDEADRRRDQIREEVKQSETLWKGAEPTPLHAHEVTPDDAAMLRMFAGSSFSGDTVITLPSGKTVTGAEIQRWLDS